MATGTISASLPSVTGSIEAEARMDRVIISLKPVRSTMVSGCSVTGSAKKVTAAVTATVNSIARMSGSIKAPLVSMLSGSDVSVSIRKISGYLSSSTRHLSSITGSTPTVMATIGASESVRTRLAANMARVAATAASSKVRGHRLGAVMHATEASLSAKTGRRCLVSARLPRFKDKLLVSTCGSTGISVIASTPQGVDANVAITATTEHAPLKHEREEVR